MALGVCYGHLIPKLIEYFVNIDFTSILAMASHATFAVPAFFIISGFFLKTDVELGDFVAKKIIRLWPVLAFSILIKINCGYDFLGLLFINNGLGIINRSNTNPAIWYICVLFWTLICFYLFLKHTDSKKQTLPLILVSYAAFFLICQRGDSYDSVVATFITLGVAYGISGVSFGILLRKFWNVSNKFFSNIKNEKIIFTFLELVLISAFIYISAFYKDFLHPTCYISLFAVVFFVFLLQKGLLSKIFSKISILGKYSYSMYLMQFPCFYYMNKYLWYNLNNFSVCQIIIISLIVITITGILVYYFIEVPFGKLFRKLYEKIKLRIENVNNGGEIHS